MAEELHDKGIGDPTGAGEHVTQHSLNFIPQAGTICKKFDGIVQNTLLHFYTKVYNKRGSMGYAALRQGVPICLPMRKKERYEYE